MGGNNVSLFGKSFESLFLQTSSPSGQNLQALYLECRRGQWPSPGVTPLFARMVLD